jgi:mxaJ protein
LRCAHGRSPRARHGDDYANPPPAHALARRGIVENVVGFSVFGDYARESPPLELLRALERGEIDVAMPWGPLAGFVEREKQGSLHIAPVTPARDGTYPFTFEMSVAVRRDDVPLKQALEAALARQRKPIEKLLHAYGVPLL